MSVSLLAVAALAVGVVLSKQRQVKTGPAGMVPAGETRPVEPSLDAIRAAGL